MTDIEGAAAEVIADLSAGQVTLRFLHPETEEPVMEVNLGPQITLEFAFNLTRAAYAVLDDTGE